MVNGGDDWFAVDKLYHFLFCFAVYAFFSGLASRSRYPFVRRRRVWVGSIVSFAAGVGKEFGDEFGFFRSAGASFKDVVADLAGICIAAVVDRFCYSFFAEVKGKPEDPDPYPNPDVSVV